MTCGQTDWVGFVVPQLKSRSLESVWGGGGGGWWNPVKRVVISEKLFN